MIQHVTATVLVDNTATEDLAGEWGLSIYIQADDRTILLDTGGSELFAVNAEKLGLPIEAVEYGVLSHAHYDHSLGMRKFFELNPSAPFYLREQAKENCYIRKGILWKYIGLPKHITRDYSDRIVYASGDYKLCDDVYLIPHHTPGLDAQGKRESMLQREGLHWKPDDFSHEQSLVFDTTAGLVIFNSCSHGGAAVIIREVAALFPGKKVYGLIGGLHLFNKTEAEVRAFAEEVRKTGVEYICTGHCTKANAYGVLKAELGDVIHPFRVGLVMEFGDAR